MKFSVCVIVWNEAQRIEKALAQFSGYTDDIVIFDTESTDSTVELVKKYTSKIWVVPRLGYPEAYMMLIMLKAKYEWCLHLCPDEEYGEKILDWLVGLDENISENAIAFYRKEIVDGLVLQIPSGYHTRVFNKSRSWIYDLIDSPHHLANDILCSDLCFIHRKSGMEMETDEESRNIALKSLVERFKNTKLEPYVTYIKSYKSVIDGSRI